MNASPWQESPELHSLASRLADLKATLLDHPLFAAIRIKRDLQIFMQAHVFAVWDFMSLVKRLQNHFAPQNLPWTPPRDPAAARLIHEITLGEECDQNGRGGFASHFQLYLEAMAEVGANTAAITSFIAEIAASQSPITYEQLDAALQRHAAPQGVREFVTATLHTVLHEPIEAVMGSFFYGREDLVPQLFEKLLQDWSLPRESVPVFAYYLDRHIQLDRHEHGPLAEALIEKYLGDDLTKRCTLLRGAVRALEARIRLWDKVRMTLE